MRRTDTRRSFTLIEMLVVIAIIGILAGLVFRMMIYASRTAERAECVSKLEKLAHALNEFRAEYGQYPPSAQGFKYIFESTNGQHPYLRDNHFWYPANWGNDPPLLFRMGLMSYLMPRDPDDWPRDIYWPNGGPGAFYIVHTYDRAVGPQQLNGQWIPDVRRDLDAKLRWAPFLEGIITVDSDTNSCLGLIYTYWWATVLDPWLVELRYRCDPPYQSYRLWSSGPDKRTNPSNPADPANQDDIYVGMMDR